MVDSRLRGNDDTGEAAARIAYPKKCPRLRAIFWLVPGAGIEPARYRYRWILSPVRLPVPPSRHQVEVVLLQDVIRSKL